MKPIETKVMTEDDIKERNLFECDKYGKECESVFWWVIRCILIAGVFFVLGLNCGSLIEQVVK